MSYKTLEKARIMQDDCTGGLGIYTTPGEEIVPIGTPSAEQIEQAVEKLAEEHPEIFGGARIDDTKSSSTSVYSSAKVEDMIGGALSADY